MKFIAQYCIICLFAVLTALPIAQFAFNGTTVVDAVGCFALGVLFHHIWSNILVWAFSPNVTETVTVEEYYINGNRVSREEYQKATEE